MQIEHEKQYIRADGKIVTVFDRETIWGHRYLGNYPLDWWESISKRNFVGFSTRAVLEK